MAILVDCLTRRRRVASRESGGVERLAQPSQKKSLEQRDGRVVGCISAVQKMSVRIESGFFTAILICFGDM